MNKKLNNFTIINVISFLDSIANKKLPQKINYAITRNLLSLTKEYEIYTKSLENLYVTYNAYFIKDENGNIMKNDNDIPMVMGDKQVDFDNELTDLLNIELDVDIYTIPEDLFDYDDSNGRYDSLSAVDIINLQSILCKEDKDRKE